MQIFNDSVDAYESWTLFFICVSILVLISGVVLLTHKKPDAALASAASASNSASASGTAGAKGARGKIVDEEEGYEDGEDGEAHALRTLEGDGEGREDVVWELGDASDDEDDDTPAAVTSGIGELSLNEDEQVRYHGRASGLHLLSNTERHDRRNEGGIWRFPKARVWPPVSNKTTRMTLEAADEEYRCRLPELRVQEELLDLYFSYVQTAFPIVHKQSFLDTFKSMCVFSARIPPPRRAHIPQDDERESRVARVACF